MIRSWVGDHVKRELAGYNILAATRRRPAPSGPQVTPAGFLLSPSGLGSALRGSKAFQALGYPCGIPYLPSGQQVMPAGIFLGFNSSHP